MKFFKQLSLTIILLGTLTIHVEGQDLNLENSLLWKIEKKHAKTSYLFGTIHMISEGDFFISKHVEKAFRKSQALFMEIDISNEEEMMSIMQYANMSDGKTLMDLLSPSDYALLESTMRELTGIEMASLNSFKPFVLESFLIQNMIEGPIESYEMTFAEMAKKDEIPILGLESVKEQMALFDELPYQEQAKDLMTYVRGDEDMKKLFVEMVEMYKAQNITALYNYMQSYFPNEKWMQKLLFDRNAKWISTLEENMAEQRIFIAVGAGHLGGEKGVIALLRNAGYEVTAVE
jgi:uncharacterized protein YbaP (TraB family)